MNIFFLEHLREIFFSGRSPQRYVGQSTDVMRRRIRLIVALSQVVSAVARFAPVSLFV